MARRKGGGAVGSEFNRTRAFKGFAYSHQWHGTLVTRGWPKKRGKPASPTTKDQNNQFALLMRSIKEIDPDSREAARQLAEDTAYTYRDILTMAATGTYIEIEGLHLMSIQDQLDTISTALGAILVRTPLGWIGLTPGPEGTNLSSLGEDQIPAWRADPIAAPGSLGQVMPDNVTIGANLDGTIYATEAAVPIATTSHVGRVKPDGTTTTIDGAGALTATAAAVPIATTSVAGRVKPDGTTITVDGSGNITAVGGSPAGRGLFTEFWTTRPTLTGSGPATWRNQGGAVAGNGPTGINIGSASNGGTHSDRMLYAALPTGWSEIRATISMLPQLFNQWAECNIGLSDGTKIYRWGLTQPPSGEQPFLLLDHAASNTAATVTDYQSTKSPGGYRGHFQILKTSTQIAFNYSMNGTDFRQYLGIANASLYLTPTQFFFSINPYGTNMTGSLEDLHVI